MNMDITALIASKLYTLTTSTCLCPSEQPGCGETGVWDGLLPATIIIT